MSEKVIEGILILIVNLCGYVMGFSAGHDHGYKKCFEEFRKDTAWLDRYMGWVNGMLGQDIDAGPERDEQ